MRSRVFRAFLIGILVAAVVAGAGWYLYFHFAQLAVLDPAGPVAFGERSVIIVTLALCAIVVIPVFVMLAVFSWRYHTNNPLSKDEHLPDWDHTRAAEIVCWIIPSIIIVALGIVAWNSSHALDPYVSLPGGPPLEVEVVALDWKWLFIYPEQNVASVNFLEIPVGQPVHFDLTANAPMNSFWIPQLGGQIMVMPGMSTQLNLEASRAGDFHGLSGNISGEGFAGMSFTARAVSPSDFDAWVAGLQASSTPLTMGAYNTLSAPSEYNPVTYYAPIANNLYDNVIMSFMAPGSGMNMDMDMGGMDMTSQPSP